MRPTDLHFRSPKEATPGPYSVKINNYGQKLFNKGHRRKSTLGVTKRFLDYQANARRLGSLLGPGTYSTSPSIRRIKGSPLYKPYHMCNPKSIYGYSFVGNHIMRDQTPSRRHLKSYALPRSGMRRTRSSSKSLCL